jgi:TRAP-type mannitol/chloroaromatic compound transport system permease small subunit
MNALYLYFFLFPFIATVLGLLVASLIWVYRDAEVRNKSGTLVVLLVLLLNWPLSLLLWLVFRPEDNEVLPASPSTLHRPA